MTSDSGRHPQGENSRSEVEGEACQNGDAQRQSPKDSIPKDQVMTTSTPQLVEALIHDIRVQDELKPCNHHNANLLREVLKALTTPINPAPADDVNLAVEKLCTHYQSKLAERYKRERDEARAAIASFSTTQGWQEAGIPVRILYCTVNTLTVSALDHFDRPAEGEDFYLVPATPPTKDMGE